MYLFVGVWKQAAERGVPVHGESSGGRVRVPASSTVVVPYVADAACHSDAAARRRRLSADRDDGRRHVSARNHPMSQRPAEGISPSLKPAVAMEFQPHPLSIQTDVIPVRMHPRPTSVNPFSDFMNL